MGGGSVEIPSGRLSNSLDELPTPRGLVQSQILLLLGRVT